MNYKKRKTALGAVKALQQYWENGTHWVKGYLAVECPVEVNKFFNVVDHDEPVAYREPHFETVDPKDCKMCLLGGVQAFADNPEVEAEVIDAISDRLGKRKGTHIHYNKGEDRITNWNDEKQRTLKDLQKVLAEVRKDLEAKRGRHA